MRLSTGTQEILRSASAATSIPPRDRALDALEMGNGGLKPPKGLGDFAN